MANEEKELYKFVNDPKYRSKVIAKIHKNSDNAYNKRIKKIEHERDALSKKRAREITRIANDRWESLAGGSIGVNRTEGKIQINNTTVLFSSLRGAEMNMMTGCRVVTRESSKTKSKKHASLGGAVAGGMLFGPPPGLRCLIRYLPVLIWALWSILMVLCQRWYCSRIK